MNRSEYINELKRLLSNLPEVDRTDAVAYYEEYFDEAGVENEDKVIASLGSPAQVAAKVKADAAMKHIDEPSPKVGRSLTTVTAVVLGILALPIALPLAIGLVAVIGAIFVAILCVFLALLVSDVAVAVFGIMSTIGGFVALTTNVASGIFYIGMGLAAIGLSILFGMLLFIATRALIKGIAHLINRRRIKEEKKHYNKEGGKNE